VTGREAALHGGEEQRRWRVPMAASRGGERQMRLCVGAERIRAAWRRRMWDGGFGGDSIAHAVIWHTRR
jgi:hypothetical protein